MEVEQDNSADFEMSLEQVKMLLDALNERNVESFQGMGITVMFKDEVLFPKKRGAAGEAKTVDEATSPDGIKHVDGFRHKALWRAQNGKVLKFDGTLE